MRLSPLLHRLLPVLVLAAAAARADVLVETLDGEAPVRGISLTADAKRVSVQPAGGGEAVMLETGRVIEIAAVPAPPPPPDATHPFEVELVCGSRVRGKLLGPGEAVETVRLGSPILREGGSETELPLDTIRAVRRVDLSGVEDASRLVRIPETDCAYRTTGARIQGFVKRFAATGLVMDRGQFGEESIPYGELAAVFLDTQPVARPDGLHVVVRLADGSALLLGDGFRVDAGLVRGTTPSGIRVRVNLGRVVALGFQGGRFVHVSDLEPASIQREPFFPIPEGPAADAMLDFVCPVRMDLSPDGNPITLQKRRYEKGIGVRPRTTITYELDRRYRRFEALCGIDDEVLGTGYGRGGGTGSVVFAVLLDGKEVWRSGRVEGGAEPERVRVPVEGAERLTLVVDLVPEDRMPRGQPDSPELDNAVWARPLLVR